MLELSEPNIRDVFAAQREIRKYLPMTALYHYPSLSELLGCDVFVKHENHQPTGAFKVRGQINVISNLDEKTRKKGVIMASTGNDAQAIAYAAGLFGTKATVVMPERSNPVKAENTKNLGAKVIFHGEGFEQASNHAEELASKEGLSFVHSANNPALIAGAATVMLEVTEQLPSVDAVIAPVGGGALAAGVSIVAKWFDSKIRAIAVQSSESPAAYFSWKDRRVITNDRNSTIAEGLACGSAYELPQKILWRLLDDFVLVSDQEILSGMKTMIENTRNLAEPSSATTMAAAIKKKEDLRGKKVVLLLTGCNTTKDQILRALSS
jgi:threonine dehydratase